MRLLIVSVLGMVLVVSSILPAKASECSPSRNHRDASWKPYYDGRLIDSHFHIPSPLDIEPPRPVLGNNVTLADIDCTLKSEGTSNIFAFFPVFTSFSYQNFIDWTHKAEARYPKRFVPFIMPPGKDDVPPTMGATKLKKMLKHNRGLFQGYGEIGLYDLPNRRADDYAPDATIFQKIYPVVRQHKLMVYFHPGDNQVDNFEKTLADNPDINFLVHGDQIQNDISNLMDQYSNIYYSVDMLYGDQYLLRADGTKQAFLDGFTDFETIMAIDLATWKPLIEAHPNRFLWSTDRGDAVWTFDRNVGYTLANYGRAFIARLDPAVQEKFAYKNAERLMTVSGL